MTGKLSFPKAAMVLVSADLLIAFGFAQSRGQTDPPRRIARPFPGFVPDEKTALAVGEAILRAQAGDSYVEQYKPLRVRKIQGRWVIDGLSAHAQENLSTLQDIRLAIEPVNCAVRAYGVMTEEQMIETLKQTKPALLKQQS